MIPEIAEDRVSESREDAGEACGEQPHVPTGTQDVSLDVSENAANAIPEEGTSTTTPPRVDEQGLTEEVPVPPERDSPTATALEKTVAENVPPDDDERGTAPSGSNETEVRPDQPGSAPDHTDDSKHKERRSSSHQKSSSRSDG